MKIDENIKNKAFMETMKHYRKIEKLSEEQMSLIAGAIGRYEVNLEYPID